MGELSQMLFLNSMPLMEDSQRKRAECDDVPFEGIIPKDLQWAN
jgi:hypothetical protein